MMANDVRICDGVDVSRETYDQLRKFEALIQKWSPKINLISKSDLHQVWERHIVDSAQIWPIASSRNGIWADLGAGGGFPAIVLATLSAATTNQTAFTMVESDTRKSVFLRTAIRELGLKNANVVAERIESIDPLKATTITARALAPLKDLLALCERHLAPDGLAIFPKGERAKQEVEEATKTWNFSISEHSSQTSGGAKILVIKDLQRA
jgi:16S rRNA (guanine527-N7)-methyltransferase